MKYTIDKRIPLLNYTKAFTLVELIVVIAILSILSAIAVPRFSGYIAKSRTAVCDTDRSTVQRMYSTYVAMGNNEIVKTENALSLLANANLLSAQATLCPDGGEIDLVPNADGTVSAVCTFHSAGSTGLATVTNSGNSAVAVALPVDSTKTVFGASVPNTSNLLIVMGDWNTQNGILSPTTKNWENRTLFNDTSTANSSIHMNVAYNSGGGYGIYYRATEVKDISGYCFQFDPGAGNKFMIRRVFNGKEQGAFQNVAMTKVMGSKFNINAPHDIVIDVVGDKHVIKVDGVTVLDFTDNAFTQGSAGLRTWSTAKIDVNEITVKKL